MRTKRNCLVLSNYARVIPGTELKWKVPVGGNFSWWIYKNLLCLRREKEALIASLVLAWDGHHNIPSLGVRVLSMEGREALECSLGHFQHCHGSALFSLRSKHGRCIYRASQGLEGKSSPEPSGSGVCLGFFPCERWQPLPRKVGGEKLTVHARGLKTGLKELSREPHSILEDVQTATRMPFIR